MQKKQNNIVSYFDFGEHCIKVETACLSGKECVFLDDQIVSERRNWKYLSVHHFTVDGKAAEVRVSTVSILKGPIHIELYVGGVYVDSDEWDFKRIMQQIRAGKKEQPLWMLLLSLFASGILGAILGYVVGSWLKG